MLNLQVNSYDAYYVCSKRYKKSLWEKKDHHKFSEIDAVKSAADELEMKHNPLKSGMKHVYLDEANRTVAIMPFLGGSMGSGHSELGNRFVYLKACFWSIYQVVNACIVSVCFNYQIDGQSVLNNITCITPCMCRSL